MGGQAVKYFERRIHVKGKTALRSAAVCLAFLILCQASAPAQGKKEIDQTGIILRLDLTKEQKDRITAREVAAESEMAVLADTLRAQKNELNELLVANQPDRARIDKLTEETSRTMTELQKKKIDFMLWVREQLTPEQKQKLNELFQARQTLSPAGN